MRDLRYLLADPGDGYQGSTGSFWLLVVMNVVATGRSLAHMFLEDGGANSIAGIALEGDAGVNLVALFGQWGLEQLLLAVVVWVIIARYRFLVPFALLLQLTDWVMRSVMGALNPMVIEGTPPGAVGNLVLPPLVAVALWFSLPRRTSSPT